MIATRLTYIMPTVTPTERKQIEDYLDMLVESDRALTPQAAQDGMIETFALTPEQAQYEYRHWTQDVA